MKRWTIENNDGGLRLDAWLARRPEVGSRARAKAWIERGKVFLNGVALALADAGSRLRPGDRIGLWVDRPGTSEPGLRGIGAARSALRVVYEDRALVVVDKPAGRLVEPLPGQQKPEITLLDLVADHLKSSGRSRPLVVHRIDRDTTGLVMFAKTPAAQEALKGQFYRRRPERVYLAVLQGRVKPTAGTWRDRLVWDKDRLIQRHAHARESRAKEALAHYRVIEQFRTAALVEVTLVTGKRNQIRVQAGLRGHPVLGERLYGFGAPPPAGREPTLERQALHASSLAFKHPTTGARLSVSAPPPDDFRGLLEKLRSHPRSASS